MSEALNISSWMDRTTLGFGPGGIERRRDNLTAPHLRIVPPLAEKSLTEEANSSLLLEEYFQARNDSLLQEKPGSDELNGIQTRVGSWLAEQEPIVGAPATMEEYSYNDSLGARSKIVKLIDYLAVNVRGVSDIELEASRLFLRSAYAINESTPKDGRVHPDADGSFAFVVPARMSRKNTEYGIEVESVIPAFRYIPNTMRAAMMLGLPPFVIDTYPRDETGRRGYLLFAPVYPDSREDLANHGIGASLKIARNKVNQTVDLAYHRFGADIIGLGAMLPGATNYGKSITNPNVVTTTGHGGTVQIVLETIKSAIAAEVVTPEKLAEIGVLGLGKIGASMLHIMHMSYPNSKFRVYDVNETAVHQAVKTTGAIACMSEKEVLEQSGLIVAAVSDAKMDLHKMGLKKDSMEGTLIIDDSQPSVFDGTQVASFGANLVWVVGEQKNGISRQSYDYGQTLAGRTALFGCEAESIVLASERNSLEKAGMSRDQANEIIRGLAIRNAVTVEDVSRFAVLFERYGIAAAPLQAAGKIL
jgi:hypothetical protein